ncbi:small ribosomal subunit biogenesis GTPase RsgA [Glaciecola sp. MH2013]|uniref:small ribosomal subunit biogenesis GTPase RsgA n=1 Tax=Glaciecola sp. MH2013 TaxID=2785524 RepID=UPI00189F9FE2|nr:small ribosomal subunit biogenesis GTPase RsgA [Glaciecola sp. MH2013]MBF7071809.1 small ribosomal subunit biogenesis GTPase RsgA [Glaciecola sp. MH2013]
MAKKPKLSDRQKRQVKENREKRLANKGHTHDDKHLGEEQKGRVIGRFGKHANVESLVDGEIHKCHIRRTIQSVVCGDNVIFRPSLSSEERDRGVIEVVLDRMSTLTRPDFYDGVKPIAANIDQIIVVNAIVPQLSAHIIDRYLVACEDVDIQAVVVINKMELLSDEDREYVAEVVDVYEDIGYRVVYTSCATQEGIAELATLLKDKISVFVGQSGVGKSSIINQLLPDAQEVVGDISENSGLGQHTTTAAKLLHFEQGGDLIDSPGVREFGLWHLPVEKVSTGFIEFRHYLGGCKFTDCKHGSDPGCLIRQAVIEGKITEDRYESYHKIIDSLDENRPSYSKG